MNIPRFALPLILAATTTAAYADSDLILTVAGGAASFNSTLGGVHTEDFHGLSQGVYNNLNWSGVGTIDKVSLIANNQYGGTPSSTLYAVQSTGGLGGNAAVPTTALSLNNASSYFGLYWSAGDNANVLDFYSGANQIAHFTTANLLSYLPSSYSGNPNGGDPNIVHSNFTGLDGNEKFAFLNFYAGAGTTFDKVVFSNLGGSGFESQSWTVRTDGYNPVTDGAITGTPLIDVSTKNGVTTQSKIASVSYDGTNVSYTTTNGVTTTFLTQTGGSTYTSGGYGANGTTLGVVHNPEPSVYLTFAMLGVMLVMVSRRNQAVEA